MCFLYSSSLNTRSCVGSKGSQSEHAVRKEQDVFQSLGPGPTEPSDLVFPLRISGPQNGEGIFFPSS